MQTCWVNEAAGDAVLWDEVRAIHPHEDDETLNCLRLAAVDFLYENSVQRLHELERAALLELLELFEAIINRRRELYGPPRDAQVPQTVQPPTIMQPALSDDDIIGDMTKPKMAEET